MEKKISNLVYSYSIIIGLIYCLFIFIQNQFFFKSPITFSGTKFACYILIMAMILALGFKVRKESGGYIEFKAILKFLLISIIIIELIYTIFGSLYSLIIEPGFFDKLKLAWLEYAENLPLSDEQKEEMKDRMLAPFENEDAGKITVKNVLMGYGGSLLIDSMVAIVFSAILKKPKPIFENNLS